MSIISEVKEVIKEELRDGKEHTSEEIKGKIAAKGIILQKGSCAFRTAIYQLRNSELNIYSRERGIYQLKEECIDETELIDLQVLMPEIKNSKNFVYVHADGKIVLNGHLNHIITSRNIEIRVSDNMKRIALVIDGRNCHKFTKSGHTVNKGFVSKAQKRRVQFPISYEMHQKTGSSSACVK